MSFKLKEYVFNTILQIQLFFCIIMKKSEANYVNY